MRPVGSTGAKKTLSLALAERRLDLADSEDKRALRGNPGQPGPRIHDLRHTFAVRSLEQCPRDREAVARHVVALSTYLGHAHVTDTYWYLHATPILMGQIAEAGEALHRGRAS